MVKKFTGNNVKGVTNVLPRTGMEQLKQGYRLIMKQIYSPQNYYRRVRAQLRELKGPVAAHPIAFKRCLSFFFPGRIQGKKSQLLNLA